MASSDSNAFYDDARDDLLASSADKQRNALMHLACFLKVYCVQIGIEFVEATAIPFRGLP